MPKISKYNPYPKYKESGNLLIGNFPSGWKIKKLAHIGLFSKGKGISKNDLTENGFPAILYGDIYTKYSYFAKEISNYVSKQTAEKSIPINTGQILFTGSGETVEDIGKAIAYIGEKEAYVGGDIIIFAPFNQDSKFLSYSLNSPFSQFQKSMYAKGHIVVHVYPSNLRNITIPLPPIKEQIQIASFLDRETSRIDTLVNKKQKQIELLQEKRSALITHAVTKGLNTDAKMKDSGIEWIGEIPEDWKKSKLKFLSNINTGDKNTEDSNPEGNYPFFVRSQNVERLDTYTFDGEAILTAGDGVGVGKVFHYYKGKFDFHQRVYAITHFKKVSGKYLFYYLKANLMKEIMKFNAKSTVDSLRLPMFKNFPVLLPSDLLEQLGIVEFLDKETSKIDRLIEKIKTSIEKIKEYRIALISAAVTGKIDVRNWDKRMPYDNQL